MAKRHCVFQVGLLIVLVLLSCAQSRAQSATCDANAPIKVQGPSTTIGPVSFTGGCKFKFVFHSLELDNLTCHSPTTLTVTATAVSAGTVQSILNNRFSPTIPGSVPVFYSESSKKPIVYTLTQSPDNGCSASPASPYTMTIFANFSALNPRLARCPATGFCTYGISQFAPFGTDPVSDGEGGTSDFFVFDLALGTALAAFPNANTALATFCGFSSPLQPTLDLTNNLANVPTFNVSTSGRTLNWRFQLVPQGNPCPANANNTVAGAVPFLSVAQYDISCIGCTSSPQFVGFFPIQAGGGGTSNIVSPALFSFQPSTSTYKFQQDVSNLPPNFLYIGCAIFLSNNTSPQCSAFLLR